MFTVVELCMCVGAIVRSFSAICRVRVVFGYYVDVGKEQSLSLTVSAAYVSPHPKTAAVQLAHARGKNFGESENWLGLSECVNGHACVFKACSVLREAHCPLFLEQTIM